MSSFDTFAYIRAVRDSRDLTAHERLIALILASHGARAHPGNELLTKETGLSHSSVTRALRGLLQKAWVTQTYSGKGNGSTKASEYRLIPQSMGHTDQSMGQSDLTNTYEIPISTSKGTPQSMGQSDPSLSSGASEAASAVELSKAPCPFGCPALLPLAISEGSFYRHALLCSKSQPAHKSEAQEWLRTHRS